MARHTRLITVEGVHDGATLLRPLAGSVGLQQPEAQTLSHRRHSRHPSQLLSSYFRPVASSRPSICRGFRVPIFNWRYRIRHSETLVLAVDQTNAAWPLDALLPPIYRWVYPRDKARVQAGEEGRQRLQSLRRAPRAGCGQVAALAVLEIVRRLLCSWE
jgi:hypothetical protein